MSFRVGIIGVGYIGRVHLRAFQALPGVSVVAIASRTPETAREVGDEFAIEQRFVDYRDLLALGRLDAVSICTPVSMHAEITVAAALAGKHVMVEKPMAVTTVEARSMTAACSSAGVTLSVLSGRGRAGVYPLSADVTRVRVLVAELGEIYYARVSGPWRFRGRPGVDVLSDTGWFRETRLSGGGVLADLGCYSIDLLQYLTGDPEPLAVSAATYRGIGRQPAGLVYDVEEHASAFIRFAGGWAASVELASASHEQRDDAFSVALFGARGGLRAAGRPFTPGATVSLSTEETERAQLEDQQVRDQPGLRTVSFDLPPAGTTVFADFVEACREGRAPIASGEAGLRVMEILSLAYQSARLGREVSYRDLQD